MSAKEEKMDEDKVKEQKAQKEKDPANSEKTSFFKKGIVRFVILVLTHLAAAVLGFVIGGKTSSGSSATTTSVDEM